MRKIAFVFFLIAIAVQIKAQETLPNYQQYLLEGDFLFNPALYGKTDKVALNLNYQKQFSEFDESPNVQSVGIHANIVDRLGMGLTFFRDQNGPISANGGSIGGSYFIPMNDDGERKNQFSFGTSLSLYNMTIDWAKLNPEDPGDPELYDDNGIFLMYANLGLAATYEGFFVGVSVRDIPIKNDIPIQNGIEPLPTKIFLNTGYDWYLNDGFYVTPSIMMDVATNSSRLLDINVMATAKGEEDYFSGGFSFRTSKNNVGSQSLNLSPVIKASIGNLFLGLTYNFGMSDIKEYAGNSFMLSVGYNLDNFINTRGFRYR
ncbi:MAG: PorP/SprF family type IX secretion system membrane protein [Flavobacteriaceae bacterium]|jgi:type IX secretion system PorP/SprF family membrane protein|nr:PorP/SprF family type IX secretion system membrane protein [Flavobacteriaceae bacterium]